MKLFPSNENVRRIELAEARGLEAIVAACADGAFTRSVAGGVALFRGPGSPLNKVAGLGFAPLTAAELSHIEHAFAERGVPIQIELSTHADPSLSRMLCARGYELSGFENVLGCRVTDLAPPPKAQELSIDRVANDADRDAWVDVLTEGFSARDPGREETPEHDAFDRVALERVFRDMADKPTVWQWLARWNGEVVGAASMGVRDGIAQLFGTATLAHARRRGVQSALLAARLLVAHGQACDLAVVTTQPGSKSHQNVQRAGFDLLYARAVWLRES
jgi:GNAT superfamily N-acetyltransferase